MRTRDSHKMLLQGALLALAALDSACKSDTPCSQDEHFDNGYCYPNPQDAEGPPTTGADASPVVAIDGGGGVFGQSCSSSADCLPPTTLCAPQINYCTAMGCDVDPTLCPAGWTCMDLTPYGVSSHMCFRQ
jgi:hypothetical protein